MSSPKPYTINIPQSHIDNLRQKLSHATFPDELEDSGWDLGSPLSEIKKLADTWKDWDWKASEKKLNEYPHFQTEVEIDGFGTLDIHFVHQRSEIEEAIPLLFVHGWPGSFIEVLKILPLLTKRDINGPTFHAVAPSLPNFGFSQGVSKRGFALAQYAETAHKLMQQLGYKEYVTQAGDWGFWITRTIGKMYPESCRASHMNMTYANQPTLARNPLLALRHAVESYSEQEKKGRERTDWFHKEGRGYNVLQSTKPQTISYAMNDSPVALLAWIYEKLHDWSDEYPWADDEILTWISVYWFSRAGPGAAARIYYEVMHTLPWRETASPPAFTYKSVLTYTPRVKYGLTYNPKDLDIVPHTWGRTLGDVVYEVDNERGGHFYAYEYPELLVRDLKKMFGSGGGAFGLIKGKDGYGNEHKARL